MRIRRTSLVAALTIGVVVAGVPLASASSAQEENAGMPSTESARGRRRSQASSAG